MICILRTNLKRLILFTVVSALCICTMIISASAFSIRLFSAAVNPNELTDGIYNIVNRATGQYLDVYDVKYEPSGKAYLAGKSGQSGQNFEVKRRDDGTYLIYPQSENGIYALSYASDVMESEFVTKRTDVTPLCTFEIEPVYEGKTRTDYYKIKPANMTDDKLVLGVSGINGSFNFPLPGFAFDNGSTDKQWQLIKVSNESLKVHGKYVNVRMGGSHTVIATLSSDNKLIGNMTWESSNPEIATVDSRGVVYGVSEGTATITVTCGSYTDYTVVKVTDLPAFTWYSQHNAIDGGWAAESMNDIYFHTYAGKRKPFFVNGYKTADDWMDMGCKLCSEAMVLHNMGALLTTGYDQRSGESDGLPADPFTVGIANAGVTGENLNVTRVVNNPVLVNHYLINPRFNVDGNAIITKEFYGNNLKHIKELVEAHPEGVVVGMKNTARNTTHYVVFTEVLNPDDPHGNYEFRVCDSAASTPDLGDNVPFKESISYKNLGYGYWSIFEYSVYEIVQPAQ